MKHDDKFMNLVKEKDDSKSSKEEELLNLVKEKDDSKSSKKLLKNNEDQK